MQSKYVFLKWRIRTGELVGFLSANKKRWSMKSCGIFRSTDFVEWQDKNLTDKEYHYSKTCIYNS